MSEADLIRSRLVSSVSANTVRRPLLLLLSLIGSAIVARILGPSSLAVIAAISATAFTINSLFDLGITESIPRIVPDLGVRFGRAQALRVTRRLLSAKLLLVLFGFMGLYLLDNTGLWHGRKNILYSPLFFPLIGTNLLLMILIQFKIQERVAAFRLLNLAKIEITVSILTPMITVAAAFISGNPYFVAAAMLIPMLAHLLVLMASGGYDLDTEKGYSLIFPIRHIIQRYWRYALVSHMIFFFNQFVFGLPLTLFILAELGADSAVLGNTTIAVAIILGGFDMANAPLENLTVPILARLYSEKDLVRFQQTQRLMVSMRILSSGLIAITIFTIAPFLLIFLYGKGYHSAVEWGVPACVLMLVFNFFSVGNATIRQTDRFTPVMIGYLLSIIAIAVCLVIGLSALPEPLWPPAVLVTCILGRAVFWLTTDLWTDAVLFQWQGTIVKARGLLAIVIALSAAFLLARTWEGHQILTGILACCSSTALFLLLFRLMGGIGEEGRQFLLSIIGPRYGWVGRIV
ncbi:MAG: hypothetical protein ABIG67_09700 [Pseudomonadota bacterium]